MTRAVINNMILGVKNGYGKTLGSPRRRLCLLHQGQETYLRVGFANELKERHPEGWMSPAQTKSHRDQKAATSNWSANRRPQIRSLRKPSPTKGKGIRYQGEVVQTHKPGKSATLMI